MGGFGSPTRALVPLSRLVGTANYTRAMICAHRRVSAALLLVLALLASACGGSGSDGDGTGDSSASSDTSDLPESETDPTSTEAPSTTEALPETAVSIEGLHVSRVVFGDAGSVTLTNSGAEDVDLNGIWLCNRPDYAELSGTVPAGGFLEISAAELSVFSEDGGEVALYVGDSFESPDAMFDYVQWGSGGGRSGVAVDAELWPAGMSAIPFEGSIELFGAPGDPEAWG